MSILLKGRNSTSTTPKIKIALLEAKKLDQAWLIEKGTMIGETITKLSEFTLDNAPYFSIVLVLGEGK